MKLKFNTAEMQLLNAICDIETSADGTKTYSMKPMVINNEGEVQIDFVEALKLINEKRFLSDPSISFDCNANSSSKGATEHILQKNNAESYSLNVLDNYQHLSFKTLTDSSEVSFGMMIQYVDSVDVERPLRWRWREVDKKVMRMVQNMPKEKYKWVRIPCF